MADKAEAGDHPRAHNADGTFTADDKSTPDVNEAYKDGKDPETDTTTKPEDVFKELEAKEKAAKVAPVAVPMVLPEGMTVEQLLERVNTLEEQLAHVVANAPQGQDVHPKNGTDVLTQRTLSGNVRTTIDPSPDFVQETSDAAPVVDNDTVATQKDVKDSIHRNNVV